MADELRVQKKENLSNHKTVADELRVQRRRRRKIKEEEEEKYFELTKMREKNPSKSSE